MSEPSSNTSQTASAFYDPASSCWRTSQGSLLSEEYPLLERLPDWGTTAGGALCVQATPEHLTGVRDGSASPNLPTPVVYDMGANHTVESWDSWTDEMKKRHGNGNGHGASLAIEAARLLPTPRAQNGEPRNMKPWIRPLDQPQNLENAIARLLPTPTTVDAKVFGPNVDWQLRLSNHAPHTASVLMNLPSNDGNGSSDDQHPTQPMIEDSDPSSSSG